MSINEKKLLHMFPVGYSLKNCVESCSVCFWKYICVLKICKVS